MTATPKLGRPFGCWQLDATQQLWLSEVWDDPTMGNPEIAARVGLSKSGLHRYKARLQLGDRSRGARPPRVNLQAENRKRRGDKAKEQLARCAKIEAAERLAALPRWRRCDECGGREDTQSPHQHGATKAA